MIAKYRGNTVASVQPLGNDVGTSCLTLKETKGPGSSNEDFFLSNLEETECEKVTEVKLELPPTTRMVLAIPVSTIELAKKRRKIDSVKLTDTTAVAKNDSTSDNTLEAVELLADDDLKVEFLE